MTTKTLSVTEAIQSRIGEKALGEPFTPAFVSHLGTRANTDQILSRLVRAGHLERLTRGVYTRPLKNRYTGTTILEPETIAKAIAISSRHTFSISGAEAARRFGLSTQMPTRSIYLTSGRSRKFKVGGSIVELRHTTATYMALAGQPAGDAVLALLYLGKEFVTTKKIEIVKKELSSYEFSILQNALGVVPSWLREVFYKFELSESYAKNA